VDELFPTETKDAVSTRLGETDIVVGIPSYNNARTIGMSSAPCPWIGEVLPESSLCDRELRRRVEGSDERHSTEDRDRCG